MVKTLGTNVAELERAGEPAGEGRCFEDGDSVSILEQIESGGEAHDPGPKNDDSQEWYLQLGSINFAPCTDCAEGG